MSSTHAKIQRRRATQNEVCRENLNVAMTAKFKDAETWKLVRDMTMSVLSDNENYYKGFDPRVVLNILMISNIDTASQTQYVDLWVYMYCIHKYMIYPEFCTKNDIDPHLFLKWLTFPENNTVSYGASIKKAFNVLSNKAAKRRHFKLHKVGVRQLQNDNKPSLAQG
jgi:hypothetical protein